MRQPSTIVFPNPNAFQAALNKISFAKPPKFKPPYIGVSEWMVILSGTIPFILMKSEFSLEFCFYAILANLINMLSCHIFGYEKGKNKRNKFKKISCKFSVLYLIGALLCCFFLYRHDLYTKNFVAGTVATFSSFFVSFNLMKASFLSGRDQPPSDGDIA